MAQILVLDANARRCHKLGYQLLGLGHNVLFALGIREAIRAVAAIPPDLIFAEWFDSDGATFIYELNRLGPDLGRPPVVLTLGGPDDGQSATLETTAINCGAATLLFLPAGRTALTQTIERVLVRPIHERTVIDLTKQAAADPSTHLDILTNDPIISIATLVGGIDVLDLIIETSGARNDRLNQQRLADAINAWGSLPRTEQLERANQIIRELDQPKSPAETGLKQLARQAVDLAMGSALLESFGLK